MSAPADAPKGPDWPGLNPPGIAYHVVCEKAPAIAYGNPTGHPERPCSQRAAPVDMDSEAFTNLFVVGTDNIRCRFVVRASEATQNVLTVIAYDSRIRNVWFSDGKAEGAEDAE